MAARARSYQHRCCHYLPTAAETVISYSTWPEAHKQRPKLRAVAAVLQQDTSAIVTLKSSGIDSPAKVREDGVGGQGCRRVRACQMGLAVQAARPTAARLSFRPHVQHNSWRASGMRRTPHALRAASCSA